MTSFWWRDLGGPPERRPALHESLSCDVCIVGGGYTGLWTALWLARGGASVVVLEREFCGFGASGRNGGWLSGLLAGSRERWAAVRGREAVVLAQRAMHRVVDEVAAEGLDCDLVADGCMTVATSEAQAARLRDALEYERSWGFGDEDWTTAVEPLPVDGAVGALYSPHCARVHPAKLMVALAGACEAAGVRIHEGSPVRDVLGGRAVVETASGEEVAVSASWVVRATEGYTAGLPGLRRMLVPMNSSMIVTEPGVADSVGWTSATTLLDGARAYCYLQRTTDGRIAIGGRGVPYRYGSRTDVAGEVAPVTVGELRSRLVRLFPSLRDVRIDDAWAGVLGVPRDWCPTVVADRSRRLAWAGGYVGDGVGTSYLSGRTLADLILGREVPPYPFVGWQSRRWEPEPLRYLAIRGIYAAYRRADRLEESAGRDSRLAHLADRLAGH